jgi:hypothetical protein
MLWIILFAILLFMLFTDTSEGFVSKPIDKYDYLAPVPNSTWRQTTIQQFVDKYNEMEKDQLNASTFATDKKGIAYMKHALEEEAIYYSQNGQWPYNSYVSDYLKANPTAIPAGMTVSNTTVNKDNIAQFYPNRYVYMSFISQKESKIKPPPEAYQIFKGSMQAPVDTESFTTLSNFKYVV